MTDKNGSDPITQNLFSLLKESQERDMERLEKKMDDKFIELKSLINEFRKEEAASCAQNAKITKDHIATVENKINNKLDAVDEALRGNGRIGIFEQIRGINAKIRILLACVILLSGLKMFGGTLNEIWDDFYKSNLAQPTMPTTQPTTQPASK